MRDETQAVPQSANMQPPPHPEALSDEQEPEAFIGQDGADGFDGVVLDDLEGEGVQGWHVD